MAISGCFKDVKFIEVLKIVSKRSGRLWIYDFSTNLYAEWYVHQNVVRAVRLNKISLTGKDAVFEAVARLGNDATSSYIFYNQAPDRVPTELAIPIHEISLRTVKAAAHNVVEDELLPNPDTKFTVDPSADANKIPAELAEFWQTCQTNYNHFFTASELANATKLPLKQTQTNLYKLRALGAIRPFRANALAAAATTTTAARAPSTNLAAPNENERLVASVQPPLTQIDPAAAPNIVAATAPRKSLIQRMLDAIQTKKTFG